ncbi:hypothetical protein [Nocardia sp. NPDC019255]|uniref:hypothetical protein n=1 Tax=Nocardia sp. NPDC019255 TaxID=3154591 RepID=UPI0033CEF0EE
MSNSTIGSTPPVPDIPEGHAMTTTELPAWEDRARRIGALPSPTADTVRDPAYLSARLTEALDRAAAIALRYDGDLRTYAGLTALRDSIEHLRTEIRLWSPAGDEFLTALQHAAPSIRWERSDRGFIGWPPPGEPLRVAEEAARALRLPEHRSVAERVHCWSGEVEGWRVQITHFAV